MDEQKLLERITVKPNIFVARANRIGLPGERLRAASDLHARRVVGRRRGLNVDDILREVRQVREAYAKQFGYDLQAIHRDLKALEQASGRRVISLPLRRPRVVLANGAGSPSKS